MSTTFTLSVPPDLSPRIILQPIRVTLSRPITEADRQELADAYASRYPREHRADARRAAWHVLAGVQVTEAGHPVITAVTVEPAPRASFA